MKFALIFAVATVILSSIPLKNSLAAATTQQTTSATANANASEAASAQVNKGGVDANSTANANASMQPVDGELIGKLDSKSAKAGDAVMVKTTQKVKTADGTVIPKGSRLIGRVTSVQAHGSGHADSSLSIAFNRAELKTGESLAIHSVIVSVAPPASNIAAASMDEGDSMGASAGGGMNGGNHGLGSGRMGGGGLVGGAVSSATSPTGAAASNLGSVADSTAHSAGSLATGMASNAGGTVRGAADSSSSLSLHATSVPGVMLAGDASGSTSGTLSASKRNVHLDTGTQLVLAISAASTR